MLLIGNWSFDQPVVHLFIPLYVNIAVDFILCGIFYKNWQNRAARI